MKKGILLLNLGTPKSPDPSDVGRYLTEFLMDPWVIDRAWPLRWFLVHALIVPKRARASSALYQKVWGPGGSPLLLNALALEKALAEFLRSQNPGEYEVVSAMRYGEPSIAQAVERLCEANVAEVIALPLYPQYSLAATESSSRALRDTLSRTRLPFTVLDEFYSESGFLDSFAAVTREKAARLDFDHWLFSFHGLPERQVRKTSRVCFTSEQCCAQIVPANARCYRAQCFATAREIARRLGLAANAYTVCFQSRLGRTPWIRPYTDHLLEELPRRGIRKLAVISPSFVADCLETLEEIGIRARTQFIAAGGERLELIPSLNADPRWVAALADIIKKKAKEVS